MMEIKGSDKRNICKKFLSIFILSVSGKYSVSLYSLDISYQKVVIGEESGCHGAEDRLKGYS